jgi:anti-sigma regulatory factor (Ser/Thr protein kinase)
VEASSQTIELRPDPSELRVLRAFVTHWAERCGLGEQAVFRACLAATEAVTNAIRHGSSDNDAGCPIRVVCALDYGGLLIEVHDRGTFREARAAEPDPEAEPDPDGDGGRGLFLIRELTRSFGIEKGRDGTRLCMRLGADRDVAGGQPLVTTRAA